MSQVSPVARERLHLTINGCAAEVEAGTTILQALTKVGVHVPHLCSDERLAPAAVCRLCSVEIKGRPGTVPACTTPALEGMQVETHTAHLEASRRGLLRALARHHPPSALRDPVAQPFIEEIRRYDLEAALGGNEPDAVDDAHPYIRVDMSRCISCFRCERICAEVQGQFTWHSLGRGSELRFVPDSGTTLRASSCVSCGACADTCPTGAIADKTLFTLGAPTHVTRTTCPYCGVGCELNVGTRQGRIVQIRPPLDAKVNRGHLCVKGRYAFGFTTASDRLTTPLLREHGTLRPASWEEAIAFCASSLRKQLDAHGPGAIGVLGSARATNEENYLTQKFARVVLGTNNVDCCARVCHAPSAAGLSSMLGTGAATNAYDDIERARTLLVFGANATDSHPVLGARIRQAARAGAALIVVDPRSTELARIATVHLPLQPGTNLALLHAMAWTILNENLVDPEFARARVDNEAAFRRFIAEYTPDWAAAVCGVPADSIRHAARLYATHKPAMCVHGLGVTEHVQGTASVQGLVNLALLTGNLGVPGAGVNPLRGQNNVQGSAHMGCEPHHLPGYAPIEATAPFETAWGARVPSRPGLDLMQMMDAAQAGQLKALYAIGYDVLLTNPQAESTRKALAQLELVIIQDMFLTETAREFASVVLPAASPFEKEGTFMNAERRIQRVRRAVDPPVGARTDSDILAQLAAALGHGEGFGFASAEAIWDELRSVWPAGRGISYARLEHGGLQWPCPSEDHPGTALLHEARFKDSVRASLSCIAYAPTAEVTDEQYPLLLVTGRRLYQFNAGTMTGRTPNASLQPADVLDISPENARNCGLSDGAVVTLRSRYGEVTLPIRICESQPQGQLFTTFHSAAVFLNRITGPYRDAITHTPEYKVTAVSLHQAAAPCA